MGAVIIVQAVEVRSRVRIVARHESGNQESISLPLQRRRSRQESRFRRIYSIMIRLQAGRRYLASSGHNTHALNRPERRERYCSVLWCRSCRQCAAGTAGGADCAFTARLGKCEEERKEQYPGDHILREGGYCGRGFAQPIVPKVKRIQQYQRAGGVIRRVLLHFSRFTRSNDNAAPAEAPCAEYRPPSDRATPFSCSSADDVRIPVPGCSLYLQGHSLSCNTERRSLQTPRANDFFSTKYKNLQQSSLNLNVLGSIIFSVARY